MSKTDKTHPYWVKLKDTPKAAIEVHDHRFGECTIDKVDERYPFYWQHIGNCGYSVNFYGWNDGFFARGHARWLKSEVRNRHGAARAKLRKDCCEIRKLSRYDVEDYDIINPRHRNSALWYSW